MPTWRKLHTQATESLDINDMPDDFHRLLWVMLPLGLDREGRGMDNPAWVKAKIMPLRTDVTPEMVERALTWYAEHGMIERYQVESRSYFWVPSFQRYQGNTRKEAESEYPAPPEKRETNSRPTPELVQSKSGTDVDVDTDADVDADKDADALSSFISDSVHMYENAIGLIAGESQTEEVKAFLVDLHERGHPEWWQMAIDVSCDNNARKWSYIRAVLRNWLEQGRPGLKPPAAVNGSRASPEEDDYDMEAALAKAKRYGLG